MLFKLPNYYLERVFAISQLEVFPTLIKYIHAAIKHFFYCSWWMYLQEGEPRQWQRGNSHASNVKWAGHQSQAKGGVSEETPFPD